MMMNIFFFDEHDSSRQNGIGTYRDLLLPRLAAAGDVALTLVSMNYGGPEPQAVPLPCGGRQLQLPYVDGGRWRDNGNAIAEMLRRFAGDSPHNVFMLNHSPCAGFIRELREAFPLSKVMFTVHDQGWCAALLGDRRLLHDIWVENRRPASVSEQTFNNVRQYCRSEADIYDLVDRVISVSPFMHSVMRDVYGVEEGKAVTVWNGYERSAKRRTSRAVARRRLGFADDDELLIFAGRPVRHKGIVPLMLAMRRLMKDRPRLRCIMCGSMHGFADYGSYITPVASRLIFTGLLPRSGLALWHAAADVGVMPSYSEPFGYSAIEMADAGLPLVVSDSTALADMYHDGVNAFVAKTGDNVTDIRPYVRNIADAIVRALDAPQELKHRMNLKNRRLINSTFSAESMAEGYLAVLRSIC